MRLNGIIRGSSFAELMENANAACVAFYGTTPYRLVISPYDQAGAEFDTAGVLTGFYFAMLAEPATA